jgi:hypothetical protein
MLAVMTVAPSCCDPLRSEDRVHEANTPVLAFEGPD